jgi:hypothetical protein
MWEEGTAGHEMLETAVHLDLAEMLRKQKNTIAPQDG